MIKVHDIKQFFEENVPKKTLREISWYEKKSDGVLIKQVLIDSSKQSFDFDIINQKIKTSDTVYFNNNKIVFVEFKSGEIKQIDFRLKATESIISFYNYIFSNGFKEKICFPNDIFQIYFVFDRECSPSAQFTFTAVEKSLNMEYKHLFSKFKVIDNKKFRKLFKI